MREVAMKKDYRNNKSNSKHISDFLRLASCVEGMSLQLVEVTDDIFDEAIHDVWVSENTHHRIRNLGLHMYAHEQSLKFRIVKEISFGAYPKDYGINSHSAALDKALQSVRNMKKISCS